MRYPGNYGFIPHTLSGDGDPCDVIVANSPAILPGALMSCKVVGVLLMRDEAGFDEKIVAVPSARLIERDQKVENYTDLPEITRRQIEHFFGITRISIPASGLRSSAGEMPRKPGRSLSSRSRGRSGKGRFSQPYARECTGAQRRGLASSQREKRSVAKELDPAANRKRPTEAVLPDVFQPAFI
jgi:hypothetical protein